MIQRVTEKNKYGRFFLISEAPEEDVPKRRVKVVTVKPSGNDRRRTDFTNGSIEEDEPEEIQNDEEVADDEDFTAGSEETGNETMDDNVDTGEEVDTTDNPEDTDNNNEVTTDDAPDTGTEDDGDFTTDDAPEEQPADNTNDEENNNDNKPGINYDSTRKYHLFTEFYKLNSSINTYIDRLSNQISDDSIMNQIYRVSTDKLREISNLIKDYMTMRFSSNTYVQSLIFFNSQVSAVSIILAMIKKGQLIIRDKKNNDQKL